MHDFHTSQLVVQILSQQTAVAVMRRGATAHKRVNMNIVKSLLLVAALAASAAQAQDQRGLPRPTGPARLSAAEHAEAQFNFAVAELHAAKGADNRADDMRMVCANYRMVVYLYQQAMDSENYHKWRDLPSVLGWKHGIFKRQADLMGDDCQLVARIP